MDAHTHEVKVRMHVITLIIGEKEKTLTKSIARQFPYISPVTADEHARKIHLLQNDPIPSFPPICKVQASAIENGRRGWWVLIEDEYTGSLSWTDLQDEYPRWDKPSDIPTVMFV
jgi:hypothetical protein